MRRQLTVCGLLLALTAGACGQKPGVHMAAVPTPGQAEALGGRTDLTLEHAPTHSVAPDATGNSTQADAGASARGPSVGGAGTTSSGTAGYDEPTGPTDVVPDRPSPTSDPETEQGGNDTTRTGPTGSDRTGAGPDRILLGWHAPVTGAAPLPARSFEEGRNLYWDHLADQGQQVLGRERVVVEFRDDKYDPSSAIQVCRELGTGQGTFLLVGLGGTDQIQACGRWANQSRIPYFSMGVTEQGLRDLPWYFALSMSYRQQAQLLAQYVKEHLPSQKVAAIITDTPNFDDAAAGWERAVQENGLDYYKTLRHPKGDTSWYNSYASELNHAGVDVVYPLTAPVDYIRFAQQANNQGFRPQYIGVGVSMGLNAVLGSGCDDVDGGLFFSPFPGLDWARAQEPAYFQKAAEDGVVADDIGFALWGLNKALHALLVRYGETYGDDLTREDFRALTEHQRHVESGIFPRLSYSPEDHFGASTVHLLRADCETGEHVTEATFAAGF